MMSKIATFVLALSAVACQVRTETIREVPGEREEVPVVVPGSEAARPNYESGSRLVARHFAGSDGSVAFAGMYDQERKESCTFQTLLSGSYCLPVGAPFIYPNASQTFADETCQEAVFPTLPWAPLPQYVFSVLEVSSEFRVHLAGPPVRSELFRLGSTGCESIGQWNTPANAGIAWIRVGEFLSMDQFVSATVL